MIICIMGPAGSGKSTLAKRLQQTRPELFARVPVDYFFVPRDPDTTLTDYLAAPFRYDWDAVDRVLAATGRQRSTPDCDFGDFRWNAPSGGLPVAAAPVMVMDGMRPHPECQLLIMIDLDPDLQTERLRERDRRWGTAVADRREHLAATYAQGCAELRRDPDLRLDAGAPIDSNVTQVTELVVRQ